MTNPTLADQCAEAESGPSWRAAMGPELNPSPFSNQASAYGQGYRAGMKHPRVVTPADHATKPSERIRADAAFPDNPVSLLLAVLRYLDAQAMDNAGKSPGDDPLITSPGSACQCGHRCDSHHAVNGHCLSCPCKGFRYYTATATGSCHCERDGLLPDEEHAAGCPSGEHSKGLAVPDYEFADPAVDVCYCGSKESEHTEATGHGFLRAISSPREVEALGHLKWLADFAYQHGAHELGYDPVKQVGRSLATLAEQLTLCAKEVNELVSSNDEAQLLYVQMEKAWESASKQREELRAELSQLKIELALSTAAIERELLAIRDAIPVPARGARWKDGDGPVKCFTCEAMVPEPSVCDACYARAAEPPQPASVGGVEDRPAVGQHGSIVGSGRYVGMYARVVDVYQQGLDVVLNNGRRLVLMDSEFQADPPKPAEPPHPSNEELVATVRKAIEKMLAHHVSTGAGERASEALSELERRLTVKP